MQRACARTERELCHGEAEQYEYEHKARDKSRHNDVTGQLAEHNHRRAEQPYEQKHPARDQRQSAVLAAQREIDDEGRAYARDHDGGRAGETRSKRGIDDGNDDQAELSADPEPEQRPDPVVPEPDAEERVEKQDEACGERRLGRGAIERASVGADREQLVPIAEIDAEISERGPGNERGGREDGPMVRGENRCEEDGKQAGDAEQHAIEQHAVLLLGLVDIRVPQREPRNSRRAHFGGEGYGLAGLEIEPEHVGTVALQRFGAEAERGRDG